MASSSSNTLSLYDTTIPPMITYLRNLDHLLTKAQAHLAANSLPDSKFLTARIAPDMFGLPFQIKIACRTAADVPSRVAGVEAPSLSAADDTTFEQLHSRIATTISALEKDVKREAFDGTATKEVEFQGVKWTALSFVTNYSVPNFYFHVVAAYMILRANGVDIGKLDFLIGSRAAEVRAAEAAAKAAKEAK
ncbi:hypothetical protein DV738_g4916, partial [Chaetothyriales sp. CBS 135597]